MANTLRFKRGLVSTIPTALAGEPLFTTDTFDLYIGNGTNNTRFQKYIASGATTQILRGDGSLYTFPLNITSPSNGQVLKYNGTSWVNDSDSGVTGTGTTNYLPKWTSASAIGNSLIYDDGNVISIGTNSTLVQTLNINSTYASQSLNSTSGNFAYVALLNGATGGGFVIGAEGSTGGTFGTGSTAYAGVLSRLGAYNLQFATNNVVGMTLFSTGNLALNSTSDNGNRLQVTGNGYFSGNVGIGASPSSKLTVVGDAIRYMPIADTSGSSVLVIKDDGSNGTLDFASEIIGNANLVSSPFTWRMSNVAAGRFEAMRLNSSGNLGLGVVPNSSWISTRSVIQFGATGSLANNTGNTLIGDNYYTDNTPTNRYLTNNFATVYQQTVGTHVWYTAPSGTAGNVITFTQAMTLDASGRLGLGVTPSATWFTGSKVIQIGNTAAIWNNGANNSAFSHNAIFGDTTTNYIQSSGASYYRQIGGQHNWFNAPSGTAGASITFTQAMTLAANGNLLIGTTVDSGQRLQVNGTSSFTNNVSITNGDLVLGSSLNRAEYNIQIGQGRTDNGYAYIDLIGDATYTDYGLRIIRNNTGANAVSSIVHKGTGAFIIGSEDAGNLIFNTNNTARLTLASTGAATFSSSVTATNFYSTGASNFATSSGNVGIGTSNPTEGKLVVSNSGPSVIYLKETSVGVNSFWNSSDGSEVQFGVASNHPLKFRTNNTDRLTITSGGNLLVGTTVDSGQRLVVSGTSYFTDSVGIGTTSLTGYNLRVNKNLTGSTTSFGIESRGQIQSDVTSDGIYFSSTASTAAATFSTYITHYKADQATFGAGSTVVQQFGFLAQSNLTGAQSNYGFFGNIAAGTNRWNLFMNGTANNYMAGALGIGTASPLANLHVSATSGLTEIRNTQGASSFKIVTGTGFSTVGTLTNDPLVIVTNDTERMRFATSGNLLVGTITDLGYKISVNGGIYGKGITADSDSTVGNAIYGYGQVLSGSSANALLQLDTTWNTTGNANAIELNVTNTASGASSKLLNLKVDLASVFSVSKGGAVQTAAPAGGTSQPWKLGQYNATAPTATGYVEVEINGVLYKLISAT